MVITDSKNKSFTLPFSLVQISYWMAACAIISYAAVYLQALSFSNFSIGIITAGGKVLGSLLGPLLAAYLDSHPKFPTARMNAPLIFCQAVLFAVLQIMNNGSALTGICFALIIGLCVTANSVNLRFCIDCAAGGFALNFGVARGLGSLGFILPAVLLGVLFKRIPGTYLPLFGIFLLLFQFVVNFYAGRFFRGQRSVSVSRETEESSSLFRFLREEPVFLRLLTGIMLLFFGYYAYATFTINVVRNIGGDTAIMGVLTGVAAAMEIPFMLALSRLRKKWKLSTLMFVSLIAFSAKILATALVTSLPGLFAVQILQGFGYALYAASIVEYVSAVIPARNLAKGQSLVFTMEMASSVIANLVAGKLYDITSVRNTLLVGFGVTAVGAVLCMTGIRKVE